MILRIFTCFELKHQTVNTNTHTKIKKQKGMMCARGKYLLMVDADGATKFSDYTRVELKMKELLQKEATQKKVEYSTNFHNQLAIVIGSRAHLAADAVAKVLFSFKFIFLQFHSIKKKKKKKTKRGIL